MNPWNTWIGPAFWHCLGALAIQCTAAGLLSVSGVAGFWWLGALAGGGFFAAREVWQCRLAGVWWQKRTPWDVGWAVGPVVLLALLMECL